MQKQLVYIAQQKGKYTLIDTATEQRWANEFFKTKYDVKHFTKQNGLTIVPKPVEDLFDDIKQVPLKVRKVMKKHLHEDANYIALEVALAEIKPLGYTFEYGLDAVPFNLKKRDE